MGTSPDTTEAAPVISRRALLRNAGLGLATVAVVGTGLIGYRAYDQGVFEAGDGPAYAPWRTWREGEGLPRLVRAAVLAPSPHNAQAWLFALGASHIDVHVDEQRRTGPIDPFGREMHVGAGAAIENVVLAAWADGLAAEVDLTPGGPASHVARISLSPSATHVSPLYQQIPHRHTNRYPFVAGKEVPAAALAAMSDLALPDVTVIWLTDRAARRGFGELLVDATEAMVADEAQSATDHRWFRQSWDDLQRHRDGITLDAAGLPPLTATLGKLLPAQSRGSLGESWIDSTRTRHTRTAAAYGIVAVRDGSDTAQRLRGGRTLQRIHLWASGAGLGLHHMNQVTERADREVQLGITPRFGDAAAELVPDGWHALCSFRLGHPTEPATPSPRRDLQAVLLP